jgi:putative oxidoreductase
MSEDFVKHSLAPLLLRWALAAIFIYHGLNLVFGYPPEQFVRQLVDGTLNLEGGGPNEWGAIWMNAAAAKEGAQPPPALVQQAVAWGQLAGGVALFVGLLTRVAALGLIVIMGGAIATVHWQNGFDIQKHGFEYNMLIIVVCLVLVLAGPGNMALDRFFRRRRQ